VYGTINGEEVRLSLKTRTLAIAEGKVAGWMEDPKRREEEQKREEELKEIDKTPLLGKARDKFLLSCQSTRNLNADTFRDYTNAMKLLVEHKGENARLKDIRVDDIEAIVGMRFKAGIAPRTRKKELKIMRMFFRYCMRDEWVRKNPGMEVIIRIPKTVANPPLEDEEIEKLVAACDLLKNPFKRKQEWARKRAKALILCMAYTGLRVSDMATLRRSEVKSDGSIDHVMIKTKSVVWTRLGERALTALLELPPMYDDYYFWNGKSQEKTPRRAIRQTVNKVAELAGLKDVNPHRFRDTFSRKVLEETGDIYLLQQLLGHENVETTEESYKHIGPKQRAAMSAALDRIEYGKRDGTTGRLIEMPKHH